MPNIHLGRFPTSQEYKELEDKGIKHCINLATEQQVQESVIPQTRLPFLDQTIQSPESLHEGVLLMEKYKDKGVYIHCTLGLSRSVLLVSAWLLYTGHTVEEVEKRIGDIRPQYIKSPYMGITLNMYKEYLGTFT